MRATLAAFGALFLLNTGSAAEIIIDAPAVDSLTAGSTVSSRGVVEPSGPVQVRVHPQAAKQAFVSGQTWSVQGVTLPSSLNVLSATAHGIETSVLVTRATGVSAQSKQKISLRWSPGTADVLKQIAAGTLQNVTAQQQDAFSQSVMLQTEAIIARNFARWTIEIVPVPDSETHTIDFLALDGPIFGQSPYDCGNVDRSQSSEVWVGTYRKSMVSHLESWSPMRRTDSFGERIADVAHALGRTATHEVSHSLGLVGEDMSSACKWMRGCDGGHNCSSVDSQNPLADRFNNGHYIMDPGHRTTNFARIAEGSGTARGTRSPATFNRLNSDYLTLIHPR